MRLTRQLRPLISFLLLATATFAQTPAAQLAADDFVRIREFYRLASQIQNLIWPGWSGTPAPLLLVTSDTEFLTHRAEAPLGSIKSEMAFIFMRVRTSSQGERVLYGRDLCCSGGTEKAEAAKLPGAGIGPKQCPGKCEAEKGWPGELRRIMEARYRRGVRVKGGLKTRAFSSRWC